MAEPTKQSNKPPKKPETGRLPEMPERRPGWEPVGSAYEGRKRPDGLGRGWC